MRFLIRNILGFEAKWSGYISFRRILPFSVTNGVACIPKDRWIESFAVETIEGYIPLFRRYHCRGFLLRKNMDSNVAALLKGCE